MDNNSLIKEIGRSFIVSSMLPAAFFITLGVFVYRAVIPDILSTPIFPDQLSSSLWLLLSTVIMWVGFALYSMVHWTVRLYEGYYFPNPVKKLLIFLFYRFPHNRKRKYINAILQAKREQDGDWRLIVGEFYDKAWSDYEDIEISSPLLEDHLLPTKLGNVLRASEQYPQRYGLTSGINLWPRLATLIPTNVATNLEEKNNNMLFLLNSSLLSYCNGAIGVVMWAICKFTHLCSSPLITVNTRSFINLLSSPVLGFSENGFLILGVIWFVMGYWLYIMSIPVAKTIGLLIRSCFDLYRLDLLKQLNYPIPKTLKQERKIWAKICDFIVTGGDLGIEPLKFEYNLRTEFRDSSSKFRTNFFKRLFCKK